MRKWWLLSFVALSLACQGAGSVANTYGDHPQMKALVDRMVAEHGFDREQLLQLFARAEKKQSIIDAMNRPAERVKPWHEYREIFIQERRIAMGVDFWRQHRAELERAREHFGVDPAIIVAIIGVETNYGRNKGSYRVIDALSTLAFDYPKRSPFFTKELENFLLLTRDQQQDPLKLVGSYAGAMGYGQFMPSSYRNYAVDFDGDDRVDIWDNTTDAIGSVANYFVRHGWQSGEPVAVEAKARNGYSEDGINELRRPERTLAQLSQAGFAPVVSLPEDAVAMPLRLEVEGGDEFWLGLPNFYVITRYNHSHRYAMAVYQLSELIRERVGFES